MGRPVRSHADFAVILLAGQDLTTYVGRKDVLSAMGHDSRNQLNLCYELADMARSGTTQPDTLIRQVIDQCLQRDPGWKSYYNHKIRDVAKKGQDVDVVRIKLADHERRAHILAYNNNLVDAKQEFEKAIDEAQVESEERGIYLQRLSRIAYLSDPAAAMQLQQGARAKNLALSIPPALPRNLAVHGGKSVAEKMCVWFGKFSNLNYAVL